MNTKTAIFQASIMLAASSSAAMARTINLSTTQNLAHKWVVEEITDGQVVSAAPVYIGKTPWGKIPGITVPFTDCDGYWRAKRHFGLPAGATNAVLTITGIGADDRAVIELNGVQITSAGTYTSGSGFMQFHDRGARKNEPYEFQFISGKVTFTDSIDLKPGRNYLKVIINNTNNGIQGSITPITQSSPSNFGIAATVTYTP